MTPRSIDEMSWYEYELYIDELKKELEAEAEQRKKEEEAMRKSQKSSNSRTIFNSVGSQLRGMFKRK